MLTPAAGRGVDRPADEIVAMARGEGWTADEYERGGLFRSVEIWIEGAFMLEVFDPKQFTHYKAQMTPDGWRAYIAQLRSA